MDCKKIYDQMIENAKLLDRKKYEGEYLETHHILPKSIGGDDSPENLVNLTAREHYIAHLLLWRMSKGQARRKMAHAFSMMRGDPRGLGKFTSHTYALTSRAAKEAMKGTQPCKGYKQTEEHKTKRLAHLKGNQYGLGHKKSDEFKKAQAERMRGRVITDETRQRMRDAQARRKAEKQAKLNVIEV